ncbi:MAG TPA: hypothetical protein VGG03_08170 [Thermoanaerobaculia bacterium]|jgi:hypothetical protein
MKALIRSAIGAAVILALVTGSPALAGDNVIHKGVDLWMTVAGFAQTSFASEPIPADFFCPGSQPFTGTIYFKGAPLAAEPAASLGAIDTVVRRLDDAAFDAKGVAYTRIQLMALSLVSTRPVETSCGSYDVAVRLDGEQPMTNMRIVRTNRFGGTYAAPLALNVKVVFTPVQGDKSARRELTHRVNLGPAANSVWAYTTKPRYEGTPRIDTNGDSAPDTALPAASNFLAGVSPVAKAATATPAPSPYPICPRGQCPYQSCHCNPDSTDPYESNGGCDSSHMHCIWTCVPCDSSGGIEALF